MLYFQWGRNIGIPIETMVRVHMEIRISAEGWRNASIQLIVTQIQSPLNEIFAKAIRDSSAHAHPAQDPRVGVRDRREGVIHGETDNMDQNITLIKWHWEKISNRKAEMRRFVFLFPYIWFRGGMQKPTSRPQRWGCNTSSECPHRFQACPRFPLFQSVKNDFCRVGIKW